MRTPSFRPLASLVAVSALLLTLAACGGAGSDRSTVPSGVVSSVAVSAAQFDDLRSAGSSEIPAGSTAEMDRSRIVVVDGKKFALLNLSDGTGSLQSRNHSVVLLEQSGRWTIEPNEQGQRPDQVLCTLDWSQRWPLTRLRVYDNGPCHNVDAEALIPDTAAPFLALNDSGSIELRLMAKTDLSVFSDALGEPDRNLHPAFSYVYKSGMSFFAAVWPNKQDQGLPFLLSSANGSEWKPAGIDQLCTYFSDDADRLSVSETGFDVRGICANL